ncbi:uncharacterized protein LOC142338305 [Convolutriloba macropyga]|uniref:uncharacterized protein LOC142338305 n=1 Tax=Convolutriloba macropyga TaxID=536237 RepID=UPI003F524C9E
MESRTNRKSVSFRETIDSQVIEQETTISSTHSNLPHQHLYQYETNSGLNTIESIQNLTLEQDANFTIQQMLAAKNINVHHISGKLNREAQSRSRKLKRLVVKAVIILFSIFSSCIFAFTLALAFRVNAHLLYESVKPSPPPLLFNEPRGTGLVTKAPITHACLVEEGQIFIQLNYQVILLQCFMLLHHCCPRQNKGEMHTFFV